ncbi:MAG: hypothetical protein II926_01750, partial [Bacteroidales bacterium]|nr:hypothetical protein [Bacteroidales bacterium]
ICLFVPFLLVATANHHFPVRCNASVSQQTKIFVSTTFRLSRAGPSAVFLWVPFLSPPKEMEQ